MYDPYVLIVSKDDPTQFVERSGTVPGDRTGIHTGPAHITIGNFAFKASATSKTTNDKGENDISLEVSKFLQDSEKNTDSATIEMTVQQFLSIAEKVKNKNCYTDIKVP